MTRARIAPLIGSLWVAAGFVAVRVFWRLVTDGFDPESLGKAAWAALPFAALIVVCGLVSSLIDMRRLLVGASGLRLGGSVALAMVIGVSVVLELARAAASIRRSQLLRGSRRRSALLVSLLEHAIERALALAASLDLRGFGSRRPATATEHAVRFERVSVRYGARAALDAVDLELRPGLTVLTGPTGGGKTTLLEAIAGLTEHFHGASRTGELSVCGVDRVASVRDTAALVGYLPQNPRLAFIGETVITEYASTRRAVTNSPEWSQNAAFSGENLHFVNTRGDKTRRVVDLSAGEAVQLALDGALAGSPPVLLLDEPFADLDADARALLRERIRVAVARECIVVVAEHHTAELAALSPRWLSVVDGQVSDGRWQAPELAPSRKPARVGSDVAVNIDSPTVNYRGVLSRIDFHADLPVGSLIAVLGPNGSGKSSLFAGLARPAVESVWVRGVDAHGRTPRPNLVALVPEDAREFFFCETLAEELKNADRIAKVSTGLTELSLRSLLRSTDVDALLATHPRDLSAGTQRALAIAIQLSHKPGLLLVDEPTRGLDPDARADMAEVLRCVTETGTVVLFATHDIEFADALTTSQWMLRAGEVSRGPSLDCAPLRSGTGVSEAAPPRVSTAFAALTPLNERDVANRSLSAGEAGVETQHPENQRPS